MVRIAKACYLVRLKEVFEGGRRDFWIFEVIQVLFEIRSAVGAVILIEPGSRKCQHMLNKNGQKQHLHCNIGKNVRWVVLESRLHFVVQIIQRAKALELGFLSVDIGKVLGDFLDVSAITED